MIYAAHALLMRLLCFPTRKIVMDDLSHNFVFVYRARLQHSMTKIVRIENADVSPYKVIVQIWDKGYPDGEPDKLANEITLNNPCDMTDASVYLTNTRYLVIKEG